MAPFSSEKLKNATSEIVAIVNFLTLGVCVKTICLCVGNGYFNRHFYFCVWHWYRQTG